MARDKLIIIATLTVVLIFTFGRSFGGTVCETVCYPTSDGSTYCVERCYETDQ